MITLEALMVSKALISVLRSRPVPKRFFKSLKYSMAYSTSDARCALTISISASIFNKASSAFVESNRVIRIMGICVSFNKSSFVISRMSCFLNGLKRSYKYT